MAKDGLIEMDGIVVEVLPNSEFKVELDNIHVIKARSSSRLRKQCVRLLVGDKVRVEISPYNLTKGRIIERII
jgi:translation initiation factor IF-1